MVVVPPLVAVMDHFYSTLSIQGPFRIDADGLQGRGRALAQGLVVVYHQHVPVGEDHLLFCHRRFFQVEGNPKL